MFGDVAHGGHWISGMSEPEDVAVLVLGTSRGLWGVGVAQESPCPRVPSSCFREYFVHKFRAMLGKNRVIFPGEKVPGGGTGGPGVAPGLVTVPAVPTGAAGSVRGPSLQCHGPAGAGGESGDWGGLGGAGLVPPSPHTSPHTSPHSSPHSSARGSAGRRPRGSASSPASSTLRVRELCCCSVSICPSPTHPCSVSTCPSPTHSLFPASLPFPALLPVPCPIPSPTVCSLPILALIPLPCPISCPLSCCQFPAHCLFPAPFPPHYPLSTPFPAPLSAPCPITNSLH